MARIQLYPQDNIIEDSDKLVGSDGAAGENLNKTKNFTVGQLKAYINDGLVGPQGPEGPAGQNAVAYSKVYLATLFCVNSSGSSPMSATVGYNSFPGTIAWTNLGSSNFRGTLSGAFTSGKTFVFNSISNGNQHITFLRETNDTVLMIVRDLSSNVYPYTINNISVRIEVTN